MAAPRINTTMFHKADGGARMRATVSHVRTTPFDYAARDPHEVPAREMAEALGYTGVVELQRRNGRATWLPVGPAGCASCGEPISADDGGAVFYHTNTGAMFCDGDDDRDRSWAETIAAATPAPRLALELERVRIAALSSSTDAELDALRGALAVACDLLGVTL